MHGDQLGVDVALSGDAKIMAVGAQNADPEGVRNAGLVRLYGKNGTDWNMFQQIKGFPAQNYYFGYSLDLSHDGSTLAVGARLHAVFIYALNDINSEYDLLHTTADVNAFEVCVSGDGSAVGLTTTATSYFQAVGARIFVRNGDGFQQRGPTFTDYGTGSQGGIALNYDGTIVAVGDNDWVHSDGRVGVFQWRDDNGDGSMVWMQMGSDITGDWAGHGLGWLGGVSITYDGLTVAVSAGGYDEGSVLDKGQVRVYNHDLISSTWNQVGRNLVGDNQRDYFSKISLSSDGKYLAAGAYGTGNYVKIFEKIGSNYEMIGEKVSSGEGRYFGWAVDMSADGAAVAIGDYFFVNDKGRAYLWVRDNLPSTPSGNGNGGMYLCKKRFLVLRFYNVTYLLSADPHFTTFSGMAFDYHGECDLVMLSSPSFASGSGLSVHIRTTRMDGKLFSYSYISGAAVGIGNDVLEVQQDGTLFVNGKRHVNNDASLPTEFATYPFTKNMIGKKKKITQYVLNLTDTNIGGFQDKSDALDTMIKSMVITIHANPKTHMLFVKIDGELHDGIGLLGHPLAGNRLLGRDSVTDMSKDWNKYGEEWQVRDTEQKLFQEHRAPQYPNVCIYHASDDDHSKKKTHNLRRRLLHDGEDDKGKVTREAANAVCKDFAGVNKDNCVHDVMVVGDLEVAEDPSYGI